MLCEQIGVAALAIPEEYGGAGFILAETYVVLEELGYALTPSPLLGSAVVAARQSAGPSTDEPRCSSGSPTGTVATLAWAGVTGAAQRTASASPGPTAT